MIVGFLLVVLAVIGAGHYYLWRRLVRDTTRPGLARRIGTGAFLVLSVLLVGTFVGSRVLPFGVERVIAWPGYLWLAVFFYLLVILAVLELPTAVARWLVRGGQQSKGDRGELRLGAVAETAERQGDEVPAVGQSRRLFLGRAVAVTAGVAAVGIVGSGVSSALGLPRLRRIEIPLAKLPSSADGLRIALVSDIHLGPLNGLGRTRRIVEMINDLDADLVAVVGDLVDGSVADLGPAAAPLADLRARHGSYFVTGNHEYFSGYQEWVDEVARLGLRPLRNERVELPGGLDLAGVNDVTGAGYGDGPDLARALADRDPTRPVVLLAHQPIQAQAAATHGVDLQLSGHTHGGQIVPFNLIVRASGQPVVSGLGEVDGMPIFVTNGAGFWGPPVRVGAPAEVTLVQLRTP